jgi:hypothetical protein
VLKIISNTEMATEAVVEEDVEAEEELIKNKSA